MDGIPAATDHFHKLEKIMNVIPAKVTFISNFKSNIVRNIKKKNITVLDPVHTTIHNEPRLMAT